MNQVPTATIEDYKKYVRELKTRIKVLTDANAKLTEEALKRDPKDKRHPTDMATLVVKATKSALLIQKAVRGFLARAKLKKTGRLRATSARSDLHKQKTFWETEALMLDMCKGCLKTGLSLEMLYRAADTKCSGVVPHEDLGRLMQRLKMGFSRKQIEQFLHAVDEHNTGTITKEAFHTTLFAYSVSSESATSQTARAFTGKLVDSFRMACQSSTFDLPSLVTEDKLTKEGFFEVVDQLHRHSTNRFFEKDSHLLFSYFDKRGKGWLDRRQFLFDVLQSKAVDNGFQGRAREQLAVEEEAVLESAEARVHSTQVGDQQTKDANQDCFGQFVKAFEKHGKSLNHFFDKLAVCVVENKSTVRQKRMSLADLEGFVNAACPFLPPGLLHSLSLKLSSECNSTPLSHRPPSSHCPLNKNNVLVDLIGFKNSLVVHCRRANTSKLLKALFVVDTISLGIDVPGLFSKLGLTSKRKVNFSEFFSFAQKAFGTTQSEAEQMFEQMDRSGQSTKSVATLVEELAGMQLQVHQGRQPFLKTDDGNRQAFERIKRKVMLGSIGVIEKVLGRIQEEAVCFAKDLDKPKANSLFRNCLSDVLTNDEIGLMVDRIDRRNTAHIELHELLDFLVDNFSAKREVVEVYVRVIGGYLEKNGKGQSTEEYFREHKLHPEGVYDKLTFTRKLQAMFGFTEAHAELFFEEFKSGDCDTVCVKELVGRVNGRRRVEGTGKGQKENRGKEGKGSGREGTEGSQLKGDSNSKVSREEGGSARKEDSRMKAKLNQIMGSKPKDSPDSSKAKQSRPKPTPDSSKLNSCTPKDHKSTPVPQPNNTVSEPQPPPLPAQSSFKQHDVSETLPDKKQRLFYANVSFEKALDRLRQLYMNSPDEFRSFSEAVKHRLKTQFMVLEHRSVASAYFDATQTASLLPALFYCDTDKNGQVDPLKWGVFEKALGMLAEEPPKVQLPDDPDIADELDFFKRVTKGMTESERLPRAFLNEFLDNVHRPLSLIAIIKGAEQFLGNASSKQLHKFRKVLMFLDDNRNGFFSFFQLRFVVELMHQRLHSASFPSKLQAELLMAYGLNREVLVSLGNSKMDTFVTRSCLDLTADKPAKTINTMTLAMNLCFWINDQDHLEVFFDLLGWCHSTTNGFIVAVDDLLQRTGVLGETRQFASRLTASMDSSLVSELRQLKLNSIRSVNHKPVLNVLKDHMLSPRLCAHFGIAKQQKSDLVVFQRFLLFVDFQGVDRRSSIARVSAGDLMKGIKSLEEVSQFSVESARAKVAKCRMAVEDLTSRVSQAVNDTAKPLNLVSFGRLVESLKLGLTVEEVHALFVDLDKTKSGKVSPDQLLQWLHTHLPRKQQSTKSTPADNNSPKSTLDCSLLSDFTLTNHDYFRGKTTILNSHTAALKRALELVTPLTQPGRSACFVDPEFGPNRDDPDGTDSIYPAGVTPGFTPPSEMKWVRIGDQTTPQPAQFIKDQVHAHEVMQGELGDCWFISALSGIALEDDRVYKLVDLKSIRSGQLTDQQTMDCLTGVYPQVFHLFRRFGLFVFRFFKDCCWRYVIVDDTLPCLAQEEGVGPLVYARSRKEGVFWVSLLEKAYAKLHGSYQSLIGGETNQGFSDMTADFIQTLQISIKDKFNSAVFKSPDGLFDFIEGNIKQGSLIGVSSPGDGSGGEQPLQLDGNSTGLYAGHAYLVLDAIDLKSVKLIRVRNPWGGDQGLWTGRFSLGSKELIESADAINKMIVERWAEEAELLEVNTFDGSFFMCLEDFVAIWKTISLSKNFPEEVSGTRFFGEWNEANSGGYPQSSDATSLQMFLTNPQFLVEVKTDKEVDLWASFGQEDKRLKGVGSAMPKYLMVVLTAFRLNDSERQLSQFDSSRMLTTPTASCCQRISENLKLKRGKYAFVVTPLKAGLSAKFFANFYFDCPTSAIEIKAINGSFKSELIAEEEQRHTYPEDFRRKMASILVQGAVDS